MQLATPAVGARANTLLAASLTAAWHQQIMPDQLKVRMYITEEGNLGDPVRSNIRTGQIGQIATYIDKQAARLSGMQMPGAGGNIGNLPNGIPNRRQY